MDWKPITEFKNKAGFYWGHWRDDGSTLLLTFSYFKWTRTGTGEDMPDPDCFIEVEQPAKPPPLA